MEQPDPDDEHGAQVPPPPPTHTPSTEHPEQGDEHGLQEHNAHVPPPPAHTANTEQPRSDAQHSMRAAPASFLSLPDITHASIVSFLPGSAPRQASCFRLSEVSRVYLESFGGSLTRIRISYVQDSPAARLVALLRRQTNLIEVIVDKEEGIAALCEAIVQGCCRRVETIYVHWRWHHSGDLMSEEITSWQQLLKRRAHCRR